MKTRLKRLNLRFPLYPAPYRYGEVLVASNYQIFRFTPAFGAGGNPVRFSAEERHLKYYHIFPLGGVYVPTNELAVETTNGVYKNCVRYATPEETAHYHAALAACPAPTEA